MLLIKAHANEVRSIQVAPSRREGCQWEEREVSKRKTFRSSWFNLSLNIGCCLIKAALPFRLLIFFTLAAALSRLRHFLDSGTNDGLPATCLIPAQPS